MQRLHLICMYPHRSRSNVLLVALQVFLFEIATIDGSIAIDQVGRFEADAMPPTQCFWDPREARQADPNVKGLLG